MNINFKYKGMLLTYFVFCMPIIGISYAGRPKKHSL